MTTIIQNTTLAAIEAVTPRRKLVTAVILLLAPIACIGDDTQQLGEHESALAGTDTLNAGEQLTPEQSISSGATQLKYQADGNLVLYQNGAARWATNCWPNCVDVGTANRFTMQTDCNAVVYNSATYVWHAGTYGQGSNCYARVIEGDWFVCSGTTRVFSARGGGTCNGGGGGGGSTPPSSYIGCFTDDGNRALPAFQGGGYGTQSCSDRCRSIGYAYSGSQWYDQCFCGNSVGYTRVGDGECNTPCSSGGGYCGGGWRNSIFASGAAPSEGPTSRNMNRLFDTWVLASGGNASQRCSVFWNTRDETQKMVFRTILHRLSIGRLPDGSSPLDHVTKVYAMLGGAGFRNCNTWGGCPGSCGGTDNNRIFMSIDPTLWYAWHWGYGASITDQAGAVWQDSTDFAGPHTPFNSSRQTTYGHPRGQIHYFGGGAGPSTAVTVNRLGVPQSGWNDPYIVEMDQDYNFTHESNPMCGSYLWDYILNHGGSGPEVFDQAWKPTGC